MMMSGALMTLMMVAIKLRNHTWTLCTAFETAGGTIWVNDSIRPDGIQEFAAIRRDGEYWRQVETITVSWCQPDRLRNIIADADRGRFDQGHNFGSVSSHRIQHSHDVCLHCA